MSYSYDNSLLKLKCAVKREPVLYSYVTLNTSSKTIPCLCANTVFLRSDAAATIFSLHVLVQLLFNGGCYSSVAFISIESPQTSTTAG